MADNKGYLKRAIQLRPLDPTPPLGLVLKRNSGIQYRLTYVAGIALAYPLVGLLAYFHELRLGVLHAPTPLQC